MSLCHCVAQKTLFFVSFFPESEVSNSGLASVSSVQATVLDIFSAYLSIKNTNVLLATLLDYITCVLQYLQSTEPGEKFLAWFKRFKVEFS